MRMGLKPPTGPSRFYDMDEKKPANDDPEDKRTEQARRVAEQYAKDQRAIIEKLRKPTH